MTIGNGSDMYKYLLKTLNMVDRDIEVTLMLPTEAVGVHAGKHALLVACQSTALHTGKFHLFGFGIMKVAFSLET